MLVFGVAAIVLYTASWVLQIFGWPGKDIVRFAALLPFAIGLSILLYDRYKKANYYKQKDEKKKDNVWEDILGDDEDDQ